MELKINGTNAVVGMRCVKYVLFFLNVFYFMLALLMIIGGHLIHVDVDGLEEVHMISIYWTVNGAILSCIVIFGMIVAFKGRAKSAKIYGFLMIIAIVLQIAAAIKAFRLIDYSELVARTFLSKIMEGYYYDKVRTFTMDWIQKFFQCCGNDGPIDWSYYSTYGIVNTYYWYWYVEKLSTTTGAPDVQLKTPSSCCFSGSNYQNLTCDKYFQNGCAMEIRDIVSESVIGIGLSALAIAAVQILGIISAFMLARLIRQTKSYSHLPKWDTESSEVSFDTPTF